MNELRLQIKSYGSMVTAVSAGAAVSELLIHKTPEMCGSEPAPPESLPAADS